MNTSRFYGNPGPSSNKHSRFVTLAEAQEEAENRTVWNIIVLPPNSGDQNVDSDVEEKDDIVSSDDELYEPAGELEIDVSGSSDSDGEASQPVGVSSGKKSASSRSGWRKKTELTSDMQESLLENLENTHPELAGLSPYEIWDRGQKRQVILITGAIAKFTFADGMTIR